MESTETDRLLPPKESPPEMAPFIRPSTGLFDQLYINVYNNSFLSRYDYWVLHITFLYIWRCPTLVVLLPFYAAHFFANHLEIGVGSGYFPSTVLQIQQNQKQKKQHQNIALWDLSMPALAVTKTRIQATAPTATVATISADATQPLPPAQHNALLAAAAAAPNSSTKFDSVSASLVLHCIPGDPHAKALGLATNAARYLNPDGVFFGCTVVADTQRVTSTPAGIFPGSRESPIVGDAARCDGGVLPWLLIWMYNRLGIFCSENDSADVFVGALEQKFHTVESWIVGKVLVFKATSPKP